jgi:hypothetical protein
MWERTRRMIAIDATEIRFNMGAMIYEGFADPKSDSGIFRSERAPRQSV